jgi:hypothetical protein
MGNNKNHDKLSVHAHNFNEQPIPIYNIMLHSFLDIMDKQIHLFEVKGARILLPIFGIEIYIFSFFADISFISSTAELIKNLILSAVGISISVMTAIRMYISTMNAIKKYRKELKDGKNTDEDKVA